MLSLGPWVNDLLLSRIRHQQNRPSQKRQAVFFKLEVLYILIYIDKTLILIEGSGMNIFFLHEDTEVCARLHNDSHTVKMLLETAQLLCTTAHELGFENVPYKAVHRNHPCSVWARENRSNFQWLQELGMALCREYDYRYEPEKPHKSQAVIETMYTGCGLGREVYESLGSRSMTALPQCMPKEYKVDCSSPQKYEGWVARTIRAYQNYYRAEKAGFSKWTKRDIPGFML